MVGAALPKALLWINEMFVASNSPNVMFENADFPMTDYSSN